MSKLSSIAASMAMVLLTGSAVTADDRAITLTYSAWLPPPLLECGPLRVLSAIQNASDGRLRFEPSDNKPKPGTAYQQLVDGKADIVWEVASYLPEQFPLTALVSLPFIADDHIAASRALHELAPDHLGTEFAGTRLIALHTNALYQFHMRAPIETLDDLKGKKVRVPGPVIAAVVETLGGEPVTMPATAAVEKLANDKIDGIAIDWGPPFLPDVTSHHLELDLTLAPFFLAMNADAYGKLPSDLRAVIDSMATPETSEMLADCFTAKQARSAINEAADHHVTTLSTEDREAAATLLQTITKNRLDELEAAGLAAHAFHAELTQAIAEEQSKR